MLSFKLYAGMKVANTTEAVLCNVCCCKLNKYTCTCTILKSSLDVIFLSRHQGHFTGSGRFLSCHACINDNRLSYAWEKNNKCVYTCIVRVDSSVDF